MNQQDQYLKPNASFQRLFDEYHKYGSLVIAYDFDNTVYDYHKTGETYNQVVQLLHDLKNIGCWLTVWTANEDEQFVAQYLHMLQIPFDGINENPPFWKGQERKIYYNALLDDRAGLKQVFEELTLLVTLIKKQQNDSNIIN
jgi:predicted HAD superfamily phosphohydrolase YqeG